MEKIIDIQFSKNLLSTKEQGTSITEFFIIAPILCLLFYIAIDLNERIEHKYTLQIITRNIAASGNENVKNIYKKAKTELLKHTAFEDKNSYLKLSKSLDSKGANVSGYQFIASIENNLSYGTDTVNLNEQRLKATLNENIDGKTYHNASTLEGTLSIGSKYFNKLLTLNDSNTLFLPDKLRVSDTLLRIPGDSSIFKRGISLLSSTISRKYDEKLQPKKLQSIFARRYYIRTETYYHPNNYQNEAILGYILSTTSSEYKHWGIPYKKYSVVFERYMNVFTKIKRGYTAECLMKFKSGDNCTDTNSFSLLVILLAETKGVVQLIGDLFGAKAVNDAAKLSANIASFSISSTFLSFKDAIVIDYKHQWGSDISKGFDELIQKNVFDKIGGLDNITKTENIITDIKTGDKQ